MCWSFFLLPLFLFGTWTAAYRLVAPYHVIAATSSVCDFVNTVTHKNVCDAEIHWNLNCNILFSSNHSDGKILYLSWNENEHIHYVMCHDAVYDSILHQFCFCCCRILVLITKQWKLPGNIIRQRILFVCSQIAYHICGEFWCNLKWINNHMLSVQSLMVILSYSMCGVCCCRIHQLHRTQ